MTESTRPAPDDDAAPPLVLLAAGLGTRFGGGVKPLAPVGPDGEPLLVVSLRQARRAGFARAVVVTGPQTRGPIETALSDPPLPVAFADQGSVGPPRAKPWGTVAAVLSAVPAAGRHGLVVINGDDLYGTPGLAAAHRWMASRDGADALIVAYEVATTLSATGGVSRGVVTASADGRLRGLIEQRDVRAEGGVVRTGTGLVLTSETLVSMNLWAFRPRALDLLGDALSAFLVAHPGHATAELGLPDAIGALLGPDGLSVAVEATSSPWHGVTFFDDVPGVRAALQREERA